MGNMIKNLKTNIGTIHWPSKQSLMRDTTTVVVISATLATMIAFWNTGIEYVLNWIISLV